MSMHHNDSTAVLVTHRGAINAARCLDRVLQEGAGWKAMVKKDRPHAELQANAGKRQ